MPANARLRHVRPNSAPAYYLGRPASFWTTSITGRKTAARRQDTWTSTDPQAS